MYQLPYGNGRISLCLGDSFQPDILERKAARQVSTKERQENIILDALRQAELPPEEFLTEDDTVCIVVSDYSRPSGSAVYVPILIDKILSLGIKRDRIVIVIALGLHRPATESEIRLLVGDNIYDTISVENHLPQGQLKSINGIEFNRTAMEADKLVLTGLVTFHPMAGYSGGYKSLLPGIASKKSIIANHRKYFSGKSMHPSVGPGKTEGNPVLQDILTYCRNVKPTFCLNVVLGDEKDIIFASAGEVEKAWKNCCEYISENSTVHIEHRYGTVIASAGGAPSDYSFYQCMKVLTNASRACRPGGTLIIVAECYAGWEIDPEILSWFQCTGEDIADKLFLDFRMDGLAVFMARNVISNYSVYLLSSLKDQEVRGVGLNPIRNANDILKVLEECDKHDMAVLPLGAQLLPVPIKGGKI